MSDQADPETTELFVEESLEALSRVEQHLLAAERTSPPQEVLDALFRDFHTIKGTSGFLAFDKILAVSHHAEDLLSHLRDGTLAMRHEHIVRLMEVLDLLQCMLESIKQGHGEGDLDVAPLLVRLQADLDRTAPSPVPSPPPAAPPATARRALLPPGVGPPPSAEGAPSPPPRDGAGRTGSTPAASSAPPSGARSDAADGTVRVNVAVLDRLMNLMGELVLARNQVVQLLRAQSDGSATVQAAGQRLSLVTSELQELTMKTRMQPVSRVFERIPRLVRDLCQSTGKRVTTEIDGTATEIDKALVEAIRDPLLHIVRNAVDHGIEPPEVRLRAGKPAAGRLRIRASHEGGVVLIELQDDGRGMDPRVLRGLAVERGVITAIEAERMSDREAIELVFRPGFSTARAVTEISGRGVGMDVARTHVEQAGGQVEVESVVGRGTTVRLKMPLTLAIIPALLVRACGQRFAVPQVNLLELVYLDEEQARTRIEHVCSAPIYRLRGEVLPVVRLGAVLGLPQEVGDREHDEDRGVTILVVAVGGRRYGLVVDRIHDTEEIVIKPLHGPLKRLPCYSGATVLGDGGVALILDVAGIATMADVEVAGRAAVEEVAAPAVPRRSPTALLVFQAGGGQPCAVPLGLVARLEQVARSSIERAAGREVVQYQGSIMPVVRPEAVVPGLTATGDEVAEQQLVVFDFGRKVGMAVERIVDVVEVEVPEATAVGAPGVLGEVVVFDRATVIVDVYDLVRRLAPEFVRERTRARRLRVLLADDSTAMRAAVANWLRSSGLEVVEASSGEQALRELAASTGAPVDAVVTDLEMPGLDGFGVIDAVRRTRPDLPVIAWTFHQDEVFTARAVERGARACVSKLQREELLALLRDLGRAA